VFGIVDVDENCGDVREFDAALRARAGEHLSAFADGLDVRCKVGPSWSLAHDDVVVGLINELSEHSSTVVLLRGGSRALAERAEAASALAVSSDTGAGSSRLHAQLDLRSPESHDENSELAAAQLAARVALALARGIRVVSVDLVHPAVKARDEIAMIHDAN